MIPILHPETPAKCCSYCGGRDHDFEDCPKRKADAGKERETARVAAAKAQLASEDVRQDEGAPCSSSAAIIPHLGPERMLRRIRN
ncbi:hypothetical protein MPLSOD_40295 [Mesorhizobium sp. SOD10]|nr:hypothetical protein MPLSOD_40295 [Mesorhizobium sp. SOD10]